ASDFFGNMTALSQSQNKKLAVIGKAAAITQATIDGYLAVQKALAAFRLSRRGFGIWGKGMGRTLKYGWDEGRDPLPLARDVADTPVGQHPACSQ
ncbi:MAG: hypothetical protein KKB08_10810, partial [Gammaproteobacteria bacterium]|nr:hypothetical protein [Gammaproteobacteria bacterium]